VRFLFLKFTVVLIELAGAVALLAGIALVLAAVSAWNPGGEIQRAKLLLPDGRTLSLAEVPLLRFLSLAPGVGAFLLGVLMLGVGQLCEVVLKVEKDVREKMG
jgi:hypothetical protein